MMCDALGFLFEKRVNGVVATTPETAPKMNDQHIDCAKQMVTSLRSQSKEQVFKQWQQACLGRVNNAKAQEQRKDWMIYDIVRAKLGSAVADQVA